MWICAASAASKVVGSSRCSFISERYVAALTEVSARLWAENAKLREQLASAQDMRVETAIEAGNMHALVEAMRTERDAWQEEAECLRTRNLRTG